MPYGTDPFTDRYGDYKQPTTVDYDTSDSIYLNKFEIDSNTASDLNKVKEDTLEFILSSNPLFGGMKYQYLTMVINSKLAWNKDKILELKDNIEFLFTMKRYIKKSKTKVFNT